MKTGSMNLGFIGTGNMAGAIMGGIIKKGLIAPEEIIGADIMPQSRERVKETYGIAVTADNKEAAEKSEVLILSVKPQFYAQTIAVISFFFLLFLLIFSFPPCYSLSWL